MKIDNFYKTIYMDNLESFNSEPNIETTPPPLPANTETPPALPNMGNEVQTEVIGRTPEEEQNIAIIESLAGKYPDAFYITENEDKTKVLRTDSMSASNDAQIMGRYNQNEKLILESKAMSPERIGLFREKQNLFAKVKESFQDDMYGKEMFENMLFPNSGVQISKEGIVAYKGLVNSENVVFGNDVRKTFNELGNNDENRKSRINLFGEIIKHLDAYNKMDKQEKHFARQQELPKQTEQQPVQEVKPIEEKPTGFSTEQLTGMLGR
ncbi:MAG: hypothetical protein PHE21_01865 [Candidatus Dojkabacteria bacterium]|nr:hypothetical protein [Candidatus Dojkabacteria bacterium]